MSEKQQGKLAVGLPENEEFEGWHKNFCRFSSLFSFFYITFVAVFSAAMVEW